MEKAKAILMIDIYTKKQDSPDWILLNDMYFTPTSTSGPDGYINYKMSGGDSGGSGGAPGCGLFGWIIIILFVLEVIGKIFG